MPRRRRKAAKKADASDDVEPVGDADTESTTQEDSEEAAGIDEEEGKESSEKEEKEQMQDALEKTEELSEDKQGSDLGLADTESVEPSGAMSEEQTLDETEDSKKEEEMEEISADATEQQNQEDEGNDESKMETEDTTVRAAAAPTEIPKDTEMKEDAAVAVEKPPEITVIQDDAPSKEDMEQMEVIDAVEAKDSEDEQSKEEKKDELKDKKEQSKDKEEDEEKSGPTLRVEKVPSSALCYDDDSCDVAIDHEDDDYEEVIGSESPEFLKFWRAVLENPHDFTNWTYLLQLVEQENKPHLARRAYNGFFKRYPLCYGYWKKFSEMEKRNGNFVRAQRILERGVRAIPLSIDLWVHMIDFYINFYKGPDAGVEKVRKVFERAVKASGSEFRSEKLWNKYIQWEQANKNWKAVIAIYDRVLRIPTQHYSIFFKDYKEFVMSRSPKEILLYEEFETLLEQVRDEAEASSKTEDSSKSSQPEIDDDAPPGVESDDRGKPPNEKELKAICEKVAAKKKKIFDDTEAWVTKIWTYEEGIKRPYFHVKALERTQIKNWRDYLEAEITRGEDNERIVLLFERCLIACALYEDFWLKYARYLMKIDAQKARNVFQRACEIHLPKKPNIHMHWATFEEFEGNPQAATEILKKLDGTLPNMAMIRSRRVAVERRAGNIQAAEDLLKSFVTDASKGSEECFWTRKYSWFLVKVSKKTELARKVLKDVIERNPEQVQLYKDLVGLEFMHGDEEHIMEACDLAINSQTLSEDVRFNFSQRKLEYLEEYGKDPRRVQKTYDEHQKLLRNHKKRTQSQSEATSQPATKKVKTETSASSGNKILSTNSTRYSTKTVTNGSYSNPIATTLSSQVTASQIQTTTLSQPQQTYQQPASGDASLYYQNYWNYQQKPNEVQQYNYSQWPQYSQQQYYQQ